MRSVAEQSSSRFVRGAGLFDRVDYRVVDAPDDRESIYQMRYRAYLRGGMIAPTEARRVSDRYDDAPNAWILGIHVDGELCASIRLQVLTSDGRTSLSTEFFGDILHPRLDQGEVFVDPSHFVADPEKARRFPELPYLTVRLTYLACEYFNADTGLEMVRAEHQAFYRRLLLSETISEPRRFSCWNNKQVVLMASDFRTVRERILNRYPIMRSSAFERRILFDRTSRVDLPNRQTTSIRRHATVSAVPIEDDFRHETAEIGLGLRPKTISATRAQSDVQQETAEIIHRISKWAGGDEKARFWFRSEGIPAFGGRTAEALVREGRAVEVRDFLDHVAMGGYA